MNHSFWLIVIFVATLVCNAVSRPQDETGKNIYRVYRPSGDADPADESRSTTGAHGPVGTADKNLPGIEAIAVVARASSDHPLPITPAVVAPDTAQMVDGDMRTPPKLKEIIQGKMNGDGKRNGSGQGDEANPEKGFAADRIEANGRFELPDVSERSSSMPYISYEGKANQAKRKEEDAGVKGVAVPVFVDDTSAESSTPPRMQKVPDMGKPVKDEKRKNGKPLSDAQTTTTPSSGLSTWILLSDMKESTTAPAKRLASGGKKETTAKPEDKKTAATTRKPAKIQATTAKPVRDVVPSKTNAAPKKGTSTPKPDTRKTENENMSALEAMVKNQKKNNPVSSTSKTAEDNAKPTSQKKTAAGSKPTRINDRMDAAEAKEKSEVNVAGRRPATVTTMLPMATQNPTTLTVAEQQGTEQGTTDPSVESITKKKSNGKKKKKNKNRRRKPSNESDTQMEQKNVVKNPKQPVSAQFYNFLSREIMPTVGLGLVGVLVTAGLAGLLGYNPFQGGNFPLRRTYDVHHGYSPNGYYSYNNDYSDGGQSEEVLFREVLSGMPEGSRYGLSNSDNAYPESQIYSSQDQVYDAMKGQADGKYKNGDSYQYPEKKESGYEQGSGTFEPGYSHDYSGSYAMAYDAPEMKTRDDSDKYPVYNREVTASYVYPESSTAEKGSRLSDDRNYSNKYQRTAEGDAPDKYGTDKISSKYTTSRTDTIERQPEALYRVAGEYDPPYRGESTIQGVSSQHSWHRMGSAMDYRRISRVEPGPRSLSLPAGEESTTAAAAPKRRTKRSADSVIQRIARKQTTGNSEKDIENEIDFDSGDDLDDGKNPFVEPATSSDPSATEAATEDSVNVSSTATEADYDVIEANPSGYNILEVLKRLAQYKIKMGLSFLRSTTDAFSRYLDIIQKRVDESITNTTLVYRIRRDPRREPKTSRARRSAPSDGKKKWSEKRRKKTTPKKMKKN